MRKWLTIALLLLFVVGITACGSGDGGSQSSQGTTNENNESGNAGNSSEETGQGQVHLRYSWWGAEERHKAILEAIELYESQNPHVKIEGEYGAFSSYYEKLLTQLAGNTAPDIISIDYKWVPDLMAMGSPFVNMNTMTDVIDMSGLDMKFAMEQGGDGDYLMGLPLGVNAMGLLYNVEALAEAGIEISNEWDWDDLMEAGIKYHQTGSNKHLMILNNEHFRYLVKTQLKQKTGNNLILDDGSFGFTKEDLVEVFEYIVQMIENGVIPPLEEAIQYGSVYADQMPPWHDGDYAIFPTSASIIPAIEAVSDFEVAVARYPVMENPVNPGIITSPSMLLAINENSEHIDEAAKFIDWYLNSEEAGLIKKDLIGMPAMSHIANLLEENDLINPKVVEMVEITMPFAGFPENSYSLDPQVLEILLEYIHLLGYGELSPEQAAEGFMNDASSKIEELKNSR